MIEFSGNELYHYGMPRRSGRYPWGSGDSPFQRSGDFLSRYDAMRAEGMSETDIAKAFGMSTTQFRVQRSRANEERRTMLIAEAKALQEKGFNPSEIARQMGFNSESSVRSLLNATAEARMKKAEKVADFLKKQVDEKGMIDIGEGVERELGVSKEKLREAVAILQADGYLEYGGRVPQATNPGKQTTIKVLAPPGTEHKEIYNFDEIHSIRDYTTRDGGETFEPKFVYPKSMDSSRLYIKYAEDGGLERDGTIEIRRGVDDLSLGNSRYAQVRILVDGDKYIKGMAWYSDEIPDGKDIVFNTNKAKGTPIEKVLKGIKTDDPNNPFGSLIKEDGGQSYYIDKNGKKQLSLINKRAEEGDWGDWADKVPSQFLSKQRKELIDRQLGLAKADKQAELDEIMALTNPTVKKYYLNVFAEECDAAAVHLKAAAFPRQKYQVILPINSLKDNECYAPNYKDGEELALIRYPHGGTFEIPILKNNTKQKEGVEKIGPQAMDAIGINSKVASRLSGADFDGDTVMVIPNKGVNVTSKPPLKELEGFDPKEAYPYRKGMKEMHNTQTEMGKISNLITDMTIKGATDDELARAVKHSMVVIDAEKHHLDYKLSEEENGIASLKKKYQGRVDEEGRYKTGAATLISRAGAEVSVDKREGSPKIDPDTGKLVYKTASDSKLYYTKQKVNPKTGEVEEVTVKRTQKSTQMAETDDARTLSTGHPKEESYAKYANDLKAMANEARLTMINTPEIERSPSAAKTYASEVESLDTKLNVAKMNAPRERMAQLAAASKVEAVKKENPDLTKKEEKKIGQQALSEARNNLGASRELVKPTEREWEAIQAGAISKTKLRDILNNSDPDTLRQLAMPKETHTISPGKQQKIEAMKDSGYYTNAQIAEAVGVSLSTVAQVGNGKE